MKKVISILLAAMLIVMPLGISAAAEAEGARGTLNILSYNVSGIPVFGDTQGTQREFRGDGRMAEIGEILSTQSGCDIVGTQEDFNLHDALSAAMSDYSYQTLSSGGLPLGDGLSIFSKHPIFNVKRTKWEQSYGVLSGSADKLAEKGILSAVMEIADGVYIDFYVIHTDAGIDSKSVEARADNFRQLAEMINSRTEDRAIIIIGDYNSMYERNLADDLYGNLVSSAGLTDCWAVLHNNGDCTYDNGNDWNPQLSESIDKVMFKSGGGVELSAEGFEYIEFTNEKGQTYTDHISTKASISYKVTGATTTPSELNLEQPIDEGQRKLDEFKSILHSVFLVFTHFHEIFYLIGQGFDLLKAAI